jgi:VWFA-related protein
LAYEEGLGRNCLPNPQDPHANTQFLLGRAQEVVGRAEILTRSNLQQLEEVVKYSSRMPGQRIVIFGSPGFLSEDVDQYQLERIVDQALRLQVVISSLDPRGLAIVARQADASLNYLPTAAGSGGAMHRLDQNREVVAMGPLGELAEGTGGEFFHNNNDLRAGFGRLAGSPESYILAFAPKDLKPDGKFHQLKVTLAEKVSAYSIQARRGYFAPRNEVEAKAGRRK